MMALDESSTHIPPSPIFSKPAHPTHGGGNNNRRKFTLLDDNLLLLGLRTYGYKEMDIIKLLWLPNKSTSELKHRYKNLTCAKALDNIIKRWKNQHALPLNDWEER